MNGSENINDGGLQERIEHLTQRLASEVSRVTATHQSDLEALASDCSNAMKELTAVFNDRLAEMQKKHLESISSIEEEIAYLRELSDSQHLMLKNNIEYIKELEQRYISNGEAPAA